MENVIKIRVVGKTRAMKLAEKIADTTFVYDFSRSSIISPSYIFYKSVDNANGVRCVEKRDELHVDVPNGDTTIFTIVGYDDVVRECRQACFYAMYNRTRVALCFDEVNGMFYTLASNDCNIAFSSRDVIVSVYDYCSFGRESFPVFKAFCPVLPGADVITDFMRFLPPNKRADFAKRVACKYVDFVDTHSADYNTHEFMIDMCNSLAFFEGYCALINDSAIFDEWFASTCEKAVAKMSDREIYCDKRYYYCTNELECYHTENYGNY